MTVSRAFFIPRLFDRGDFLRHMDEDSGVGPGDGGAGVGHPRPLCSRSLGTVPTPKGRGLGQGIERKARNRAGEEGRLTLCWSSHILVTSVDGCRHPGICFLPTPGSRRSLEVAHEGAGETAEKSARHRERRAEEREGRCGGGGEGGEKEGEVGEREEGEILD